MHVHNCMYAAMHMYVYAQVSNQEYHQPFTPCHHYPHKAAKWKYLIKWQPVTLNLHLRANPMQSTSNDQLTTDPPHFYLPAATQGSNPLTGPQPNANNKSK